MKRISFQERRNSKYDWPAKMAMKSFCLDMKYKEQQIVVYTGDQELTMPYYSDIQIDGVEFSLEVKDTKKWSDPLRFPFSTVDILFRKSTKNGEWDAYKNDRFEYFVLFHPSFQSFFVVRREDFDNSPVSPKVNKYDDSGEELFVNVPLEKAFFIAKINDRWNIKRGSSSWQILS